MFWKRNIYQMQQSKVPLRDKAQLFWANVSTESGDDAIVNNHAEGQVWQIYLTHHTFSNVQTNNH